MKFIHCADIHADSKMDSHFSAEMAKERREDIVRSFENIAKLSKQNGVRAVLIAGDLFDTKATQQKSIKKQIAYVIKQYPEVDFLYLRGNHDEDVEFAVEENLPNLKRFSKDCWTQYRYDNVVISGREFSSSISSSVYNELSLSENDVNIVMLHGQIAEYKAKDGAPVISLPKLQNKNIDYLALGHIHDFKEDKLDSRGRWCYSGCLEGRGFDECGEKGFILLDVNENKKIESKFYPSSKRIIHEVEVPLKPVMSYSEIMDEIKNHLKGISQNDVVQVKLCGEVTEETEIETESYQRALSGDYFFVRFKDKTESKIDYGKYANDVSLKGEFIRLVNEQNLTEEEKSKIIMTGIKALSGRL